VSEELEDYEFALVEYNRLLEQDRVVGERRATDSKASEGSRSGGLFGRKASLNRDTVTRDGGEEDEEGALLKEPLTSHQLREVMAARDRVDAELARKEEDIQLTHQASGSMREERLMPLVGQQRSEKLVTKQLAALGPFKMARVELDALGFQKESKRPRYAVDLSKSELEKLREYRTIGHSSIISRFDSVTLEGQARRDAGIPPAAAAFAWAYPLPGVMELREDDPLRTAESNAALSFVLNGGFIYADGDGNIVGLNAVVGIGAGLSFDGPHPLKQEMRSKLEKRFQPPTLPSLRKDGVIGFTWVGPSEDGIVAADGSEHRTGAFAYIYDDRELDCFFRVKK